MKIEQFKLMRESYSSKNTLGVMLRNGKYLGYTLEDPVRAPFIKIFGQTAIAPGWYVLVVKYSPKYKEERVFIESVSGFTGIQIHGGNTEDDTLGCILLNNNIDTEKRVVWGSMKNDIKSIVKACDRAYIEIVNLPQAA